MTFSTAKHPWECQLTGRRLRRNTCVLEHSALRSLKKKEDILLVFSQAWGEGAMACSKTGILSRICRVWTENVKAKGMAEWGCRGSLASSPSGSRPEVWSCLKSQLHRVIFFPLPGPTFFLSTVRPLLVTVLEAAGKLVAISSPTSSNSVYLISNRRKWLHATVASVYISRGTFRTTNTISVMTEYTSLRSYF